MQVSPQTELTSPVQIESHFVLQQYGSSSQIAVAQASHAALSFAPVEQMSCEQVLDAAQVPAELQVSEPEQLPQVPPQPSEPQVLPLHAGVHVDATHCPAVLQLSPLAQAPQLPPQPSEPQVLPLHAGVHVVVPDASAVPFGVPLPVGPS